MIDFSIWVLLTALVSAFIIMLAKKWGIVEHFQVHGINAKKDIVNELISRMANCDFCLSWWVNLIFAIVLALATKDYHLVVMPFFSTMITRYIL